MAPVQNQKRVCLDGVGEILLRRSRRAKNICLIIEPFKGVRVAVPPGVTYNQALDVARKKRRWIAAHLDRMTQIEARAMAFVSKTPINRKVARRVIVDRLDQLAGRYGFSYNRAFVRNQKTRWGSCSAVNNINLNINLIRLPAELMDYTIMHELVHTRIKDHSRNFWTELSRYISDPKQVDRQLNTYAPMLLEPSSGVPFCNALKK
jgi:predicted metal-dependent hydrolase